MSRTRRGHVRARGKGWNLDVCEECDAPERGRGRNVAPTSKGGGAMAVTFNSRRKTIDAAAWLLGTTMVILGVLDLLIWAPLWNLPNPMSRVLLPVALQTGLPSREPTDTPFVGAQPSPTALRKASLIRSCQPGPPSWNFSRTSLSRRSDTNSLTPGNAG